MKPIPATRFRLLTRILVILFTAGILSGGFYLLVSDGSPAWQFGSNEFSLIQAFNQGFARLVTGGEFAGEFARGSFFGSFHFPRGLVGVFRILLFITCTTVVVVLIQKLSSTISRIIRDRRG